MDSYCLICGNSLRNASSLMHMFYVDDVICDKCLSKFTKKKKIIMLDNHEVEGLYVYQGLVREMIVQYKEMYDEALSSSFLYRDVKYLKKKYKDYVLVPIPSSKKDIERRGFKHVNKMFQIVGLPIVELFAKKDDVNLKKASYAQRQNIKEHIILSASLPKETKILIIDDVLTSGASMKACFDLLAGYENVSGLVFCYNEIYLQRKKKSL